MNEREIKGLAIGLGAGVLGFLVLGQVYQAGVATGLARGGNPGAVAHDGFGFFPFPPFLLIAIGVVLFVLWRRRWAGEGNGNHGRGPGGGRPPRLFEEWHRRAHEVDAPQAPAEGGRSETASGGGPSGGGTAAGGSV